MRSVDSRDPSYQTAPMEEYSPRFRVLATNLFDMVQRRVGLAKAVSYDGSFSLLLKASSQTIAKIIVFEAGRARSTATGHRTLQTASISLFARATAQTIALGIASGVNSKVSWDCTVTRTIGIAPKHAAQFAYACVGYELQLERVADLLASLVS
jgi:hypothetical protein